MGEAAKALRTIDVGLTMPTHEVTREEWLHKKIAIERRRRKERDSRILLAWLKAEDKDGEVAHQAECWGLEPGRVRSIIEKMQVDGSVVAHLAAEVQVLRQNKIAEILTAFQGHRDELYGQLDELEAARAEDQAWYDLEEVDDDGKIKTKRVRVNTQIKELNKDIMRSFREESEALSQYMTKPNEVQDHRHLHLHAATEEFRHVFDNLGGEEVSPDAEV